MRTRPRAGPSAAAREEVDQYLEGRRLKGFNTVLVMLLRRQILFGSPGNGANVYGDAPFTTTGDMGTPNERYFAHLDCRLN